MHPRQPVATRRRGGNLGGKSKQIYTPHPQNESKKDAVLKVLGLADWRGCSVLFWFFLENPSLLHSCGRGFWESKSAHLEGWESWVDN